MASGQGDYDDDVDMGDDRTSVFYRSNPTPVGPPQDPFGDPLPGSSSSAGAQAINGPVDPSHPALTTVYGGTAPGAGTNTTGGKRRRRKSRRTHTRKHRKSRRTRNKRKGRKHRSRRTRRKH